MSALEYNEFSKNQVEAHTITHHALVEALSKICSEKAGKLDGGNVIRICDLGSAGGKNSLLLFEHIIRFCQNSLNANSNLEFEFILNDLPDSDMNELVKTLESAKQNHPLFNNTATKDGHNVFFSVIGRSFYEKLFPTCSVDLSLSYITVHWVNDPVAILDKTNEIYYDNPTAQKDPTFSRKEWVQVNEPNVPGPVVELWKIQARKDLIYFLKLRAEELKDNCEGIYVMGAAPNTWLSEGIFAESVKKVEDKLPRNFMQDVVIGYFLRTKEELVETFSSAEAEEANLGEVLELIEANIKSIKIGESDSATPASIAEMVWSIHRNSMQASTCASDADMDVLKKAFFELQIQGLEDNGYWTSSYGYVRVRRKARKR